MQIHDTSHDSIYDNAEYEALGKGDSFTKFAIGIIAYLAMPR